MQATIEISMYPLSEQYRERVLAFLEKIKTYPNTTIETNGISTQVFGDFDVLMQMLQKEIKEVFEEQTAMFVLKIGKGELRYKGE
ncbi:MAG: hypothetical protein MRZ79_02255 [Bacteroidia bacterium]|nr:hypothetical protein [Bacteroidia bacterium]